MFRRGLALTLVLGMASVAQAGAVLEAVPSPSSNPYNPCGYYDVGEVVTVEFFLNQAPPDVDQELRMVHILLDGTDAALGLGTFAWGPTEFASAHYIDDDPGAGPAGVAAVYTYVVDTDLGPNPAAQLTLPGSGAAVSIGTMDITMPGTAGDYVLDTTGSEVSFGFEALGDPTAVTYWSAGGTTMLSVVDQTMIAAAPDMDGSLWRASQNVMLLTFGSDITAPGAGEVEIVELTAAGGFGADLSSSFTITVENDGGGDPRVLKIKEPVGAVLTNKTWYSVRNLGSWASAEPFKVHYFVQVGDASGDRNTLFNDLSVINARVSSFGVGDAEREDISGDGNILFNDLSAANGYNPSFGVAKPSGHECE